MRYPILVDTNVPLTANGRANHADEACQVACIEKLIDIQANGRVLVDSLGFIFQEYSRNLLFKGQPGIGNAFFKWLWDNQGQPMLCTPVPVRALDEAGQEFENFPNDPDLARFDRSDRKFVAVAIASGENPPIANATDTDWREFQTALHRYGVHVEYICPHLMNPKT